VLSKGKGTKRKGAEGTEERGVVRWRVLVLCFAE
jgi:hypothetical protein